MEFHPSRSIFKKKLIAQALAASTILAGSASVVSAQEKNSIKLEELIVTATSRASSVQDIPYNISAVQGDLISAQHITDQSELLRSMSGIVVADKGQRNAGTVNSIIVRGLNVDGGSQGDVALSAVPTVSTYVDATPIFSNFLLKDLERVEVLRGPQGTLYGSGSLGGTVRYITNKPDPSQFEASFKIDYSQTRGSDGDNFSNDIMVNIPITEKIAIRLGAGNVDNDGVIDYKNLYQLSPSGDPLIDDGNGNCIAPDSATDSQKINNGACYQNKDDMDWVDITYARAAMLWDINEKITAQISYQRQSDKTGGRRAVTPGADYFDNEYKEFENGSTLAEPSSREVELTSLDVEWDLGFATLTSNSSYYDHEGRAESDNTPIWVSGGRQFFNNYYPGMPRPAVVADRSFSDSALTQELRLVSNENSSAIDWVAGVFYMDQDRNVGQYSLQKGLEEYAPLRLGFETTEIDTVYQRDEKISDISLYGEATYNISDELRVTGGIRWFKTTFDNTVQLGFPICVCDPSVPTVTQPSFEDDDILFKANIAWDLDEWNMLYSTISEGYRRGGSNAIVPFGLPFGEPNHETIMTYDSDSVINYEVGFKGKTDSTSYTVSLFYIDWSTPQINTTTGAFGFFMAANGKSATTQGLEMEIEGYLTERLHYSGGYTYTNAKLSDDFIGKQFNNVIAESGEKLPGIPEQLINVALDYTMPVSERWDLILRLDGYYQSDMKNYISENSTLHKKLKPFTLWNTSASLQYDSWIASIYIKNITDEKAVTGSFPTSYHGLDTGVFENWLGNGTRDSIARPRTVGVTLGYRF
ncbi:TonB-dependent receptor [Dasania sp. GY-MA-18]|uniref:TonB-dependent receptor n=1 Tax=Dasania phycosphaerae TaxID=2950436 RepID=A0A9J6RII2_9GAMM|nr:MULTISPECIES: TonB-dependent receptor [Dasania]MCR8921847.1 TonB-dependent receptor [Dasania sp. GY-MA-18]MCZ0864275.1 TonB-dependent receptor [Dasania phycosphaerae]MCZ0868003.1 TonB-dependent receptor [Dasania phycosphaerae]